MLPPVVPYRELFFSEFSIPLARPNILSYYLFKYWNFEYQTKFYYSIKEIIIVVNFIDYLIFIIKESNDYS